MAAGLQNFRASLFAGVSVIALAIASPEIAKAADPAPRPAFKAPVSTGPIVTMFLEGGLMWTGGGPVHYNPISTSSSSIKARRGWTGAVGVDYQFANSPYHVSFAFRYGRSGETRQRSQSFESSVVFESTASGSRARHKEQHWAADFMVGRDVGFGGHMAQAKIGLRIADLRATTSGSSFESVCEPICVLESASSFTQRSRFFGFGPRVAIEGAFLLNGPWSIDYSAGLAALYGSRKLSVSGGAFGPDSSRHNGFVPNADISIAISYAVTSTFKISTGYQLDYYWNALRTLGSSGNVVNQDRYYHGPFVRATGQF